MHIQYKAAPSQECRPRSDPKSNNEAVRDGNGRNCTVQKVDRFENNFVMIVVYRCLCAAKTLMAASSPNDGYPGR